jgi:hypothetical protein
MNGMPAEASNPLLLAAVVLVAAAVVVWVLLTHRRSRRAREELLERAGFRPCPDEKGTLEAVVNRIANDRHHRYFVERPRRLSGEPPLYHYVKVREGRSDDERHAGEELLFRLRRRSTAGVVLVVKPSSLAPGLATRLLAAVATGPWDTQPDDLERLELPADLKDTNLLGALGPPGAGLYELVDAPLLGVAQGLGDAGALTLLFRDDWCAIESGHRQIPFQVDEILARMRPLL